MQWRHAPGWPMAASVIQPMIVQSILWALPPSLALQRWKRRDKRRHASGCAIKLYIRAEISFCQEFACWTRSSLVVYKPKIRTKSVVSASPEQHTAKKGRGCSWRPTAVWITGVSPHRRLIIDIVCPGYVSILLEEESNGKRRDPSPCLTPCRSPEVRC